MLRETQSFHGKVYDDLPLFTVELCCAHGTVKCERKVEVELVQCRDEDVDFLIINMHFHRVASHEHFQVCDE